MYRKRVFERNGLFILFQNIVQKFLFTKIKRNKYMMASKCMVTSQLSGILPHDKSIIMCHALPERSA